MPSFSADAYLKTFLDFEPKLDQASLAAFSLERVEKLLAVFGHPDEKMRFAHVAGTKGKGSTCAFLASILRSGGYRVGLYTSPHLHSLCERIRVLEPRTGERAAGPFEGMMPWSAIDDRLRYHYRDIDRLRDAGVEITYFELLTVLAVSCFASQGVQVAVLETGLGGRLDATNVFDTSVCGITPIGSDHMDILGRVVEDIAREKAGIIKSPTQRVAIAPQPAGALAVLQERCRSFGIVPTVIGEEVPYRVREISADGVTFDVDGRRRYAQLVSPLTGAHQAMNAALAIGMAEDLEAFGVVLTEGAVRDGIRRTAWPARFECAGTSPMVILDCAHTPESAAALAETFGAAYPGCKAVVVLGMSRDKDVAAFRQKLGPVTRAMVLTRAGHPRALEMAPGQGDDFAPTVPEALDKAREKAGRDGVVLVTGSVFVCAEARQGMHASISGV